VRRLLLALYIIYSSINLFSQNLKYLDYDISSYGDTILSDNLSEIRVFDFNNNDEIKYYLLLKRKVKKVFPYALKAKEILIEIEKSSVQINRKRKRRKFIRKKVNEIKKEHEESLKKLTMSEGKILVKLIYRETSLSTYSIVKSYRGRFNAFFWQTMAKLWNNDLKTIYDPINIREDFFIENIISEEKLDLQKSL
tara:strand:+ start:74969 stop:75553 length:585 start_codon:yes stop_codon:yes gene_type:complete